MSDKISKSFAIFFTNLIAMTVVWFTTGLWHGAHVNYVMWGLYFLVFMVCNFILGILSFVFIDLIIMGLAMFA